jgi:hypothetical protein
LYPEGGLAELEINEEIDLYQNCLDDDDKNFAVMEEANSAKYGIKTMLKSTKQSMKDGKCKDLVKFHLQGVHCYDILRNPLYVSAFQYFSADLDNRKEYIIDGNKDESDDFAQSDLVRIVLNLAFLTEDEVKALTFDANGMRKLEAAEKSKKNN